VRSVDVGRFGVCDRWAIRILALACCFAGTGGLGACHSQSDGGEAGRRDASTDATDSALGTRDSHSPLDGASDAQPEATVYDALSPAATTFEISPLQLVPPFSTATHDYYMRCSAGTNTLLVATTAAPGSTIALVKPVMTEASVDLTTTTVSVNENEALVAAVTTDGVTEEYWVRCLPQNFPPLEMTPHTAPDAGAPPPGYYLISDVGLADGAGAFAMALDGNGVPVWYGTTTDGLSAIDVDSVIPGVISYVPYVEFTYSGVTTQFELQDLSADTTRSVETVSVPLDIHELQYLANGNTLMFGNPIVSGVNLTGLSTFGPDEDMLNCIIQEISPSGAIVWQWDITDHFDPVVDSTWPQTQTVDGKTVIDPFHCNSIDVDESGDLLVSVRHMDSIFLVSKATGIVLWKMGGATASLDNAPYITVTGDPLTSFYRQHDARFQPNGNISLFDDQTDTAGPARAVVYTYSLASLTAQVVWQYSGVASSLAMGSFRILPDGSRIIGWGLSAAPDQVFTEVDENGTDLLDFAFPSDDFSYRAIKIPTTTFDIDLLRATAGTH